MKKKVKSLLTLVLAFVMALAMNVAASASEQTTPSYTITVKNANSAISMAGNTYSAYKLFDVTYDDANHYAYTVTEAFEAFEYSYETTGEDGEEVTKKVSGDDLIDYLGSLKDDAEALNTFAEAALKYVGNKSITAAGKTTVEASSTSNEATIDVTTAGAGYYLVAGTATAAGSQTVTAACSLTTTAPTAVVNVKADAPSVEKKIDDGSTDGVSANTASIGDKVSYEITSTVPDMTGYEKYYFIMNDTLSKGLTFNDDVVVKIGGIALTANTDYTVTAGTYTVTAGTYSATDGTTLKIVFKNFVARKADAGKAIVVTYSATVNQNAVIGTAGNSNDVTLTYSNNPNVTGKGDNEPNDDEKDDVTGKTPTSTTKTFVTGLKLTKVDGKDTTKTLAGAKFSISGTKLNLALINSETYKVDNTNGTYWMLKDGSYTNEDPSGKSTEVKAKYDSLTTKYTKVETVTEDTPSENFNATGYVDENGVLTIQGLAAGTYTIKELVAPDGYNLLKDDITVIVTGDLDQDTATCTWSAKATAGNKSINVENTGDLLAFNVENNSGTLLPTTGGIGTTIFYVLGTVLVLGAGVLLITRKRMSKAE